MKNAWQILKKHPIAIAMYLIYLYVCYCALALSIQFHKTMKLHPERSGIANGGEGIGYADFFILLIGFTFIGITLLNIPFKPSQYKFYLWLCLAVLIPILIIFNF